MPPSSGHLSSFLDNGEINNILAHPINLISPSTGPIDFNNKNHTNFRLENLGASPTPASTGRVYFNTALSQAEVDDGSTIRGIPTLLSTSQALVDLRAATLGAFYNQDLRTSGVTISNTNAESTMYSVTIPGGTFQGGSRQILITINGTKQVASVTSSNGETYRLYLNGALVGSSSLSNTWAGFCFNGATTGPEFVQRFLALEPGGHVEPDVRESVRRRLLQRGPVRDSDP